MVLSETSVNSGNFTNGHTHILHMWLLWDVAGCSMASKS